MHHFWNYLLRPVCEALRPASVLQIGASQGILSGHLADFGVTHGASLTIVDPFPRFDVSALVRSHGASVVFYREKSLDALPHLSRPDLVFIDGDHNWYTVLEELRALWKIVGDAARFPVVVLHDTGWPHGRRDAYSFPADIPERHRQPMVIGGVEPGRALLVPSGGLHRYSYHATFEGGDCNGVRTAVDDFLAETPGLARLSIDGFRGVDIVFPVDFPSQNSAVSDVFRHIESSAFLREHIRSLEADRLREIANAEESTSQLWRERTAARREQHRQELRSVQSDLNRILRSKSWRLTLPLRKTEAWLRDVRTRKGCMAKASSAWKFFGSPLPGLARWVRHGLLGGLFPAAASADERAQALVAQTYALYGGVPSLSVIVTARNNGAFIKECLYSILHQSVRPLEVIYCDDGSTDDSLRIVRSIPGVTILARQHEGVVKARNAAVQASKGDLLLHVDGDDTLTPHYLAEQLATLATSPDAPFVYGGFQASDMDSRFVAAHPWDHGALWTENYVNTSSLCRRSAFDAVGGWQEGSGTLWDWHLWLRMSRLGRGVPCNAILHYRRHLASWTNAVNRTMNDAGIDTLLGRTRRSVARVSVCCVFGGRLSGLLPLWMDSLSAAIRAQTEATEAPELVVLDHTCSHGDRIRSLAARAGVFRSVTVIPYRDRFTFRSELERRHQVAMFLGRAYNRLLSVADGEVVWFLEDDVVVPEHAYVSLLHALTDGLDPPAAVSGLYRNRHQDDWIAHTVDASGTPQSIDPASATMLPIDLAGTGCLMALKAWTPFTFGSHWRGHCPAHDWTWSDKIRASGRAIHLLPSVRCQHYTDETRFV